MEPSRGKKGKKSQWQMSLGVKEIAFAAMGIAGLMMFSFALGALAGRGDIYRAASTWGLMSPEPGKPAQYAPAPAAVTAAAPGSATTPTAAAGVPASAPGATASTGPAPAAPVVGNIAGLPAPAKADKKAKSSGLHKDQKAKDEELRKLKQEVARKLKFQNSFDTTAKSKSPKSKPKEQTAAGKPQTTQVKVASFRDEKSAKARVAELQKKGIKAGVKQGKDQKGAVYTVYKQVAAAPAPDGDQMAKKSPKPPEKKTKSQ